MELTRGGLDEIMRKKLRNYDKLCNGEEKANIQECITFFIAGYDYVLGRVSEHD